ncbi:15-cis-phytoene synthase CrtB [Roseofilum casamattae]|uniref:Phytoene synthase n=1 Tax=Roseofilum casamattae BLCC-M143 TaxID=3022442 RepID=A0ABT7BRD1_9CYAN|nr:phytoene synthase [Roseofilum casamattae]MDJ1181757.1 phytoene synthase [Roseofilum casamattae BLCC-M143]
MLQIPKTARMRPLVSLEESYELCRQITATYAKTFYLGTLLMPEAKRRAIWAIYAWCRHTDELVDGKESEITTPDTLDRWEDRLEEVFSGKAKADEEVALVHTLEQFPLEIQPFRDMIAGQRMDLFQNRYHTFDDLYLYCYRVAGTVGLMSTKVMGVNELGNYAPWHRNREPYVPLEEAIALGIANQLTNILRDVGEDIQRGRIYLPLEELALFDYTEADLLNGVIDKRWKEFMRFQIQRARKFFKQAERGVQYLISDARWPVWSALMLYQQILGAIERNDYDVFTKRAYVSLPRKLVSLPVAYMRSQIF